MTMLVSVSNFVLLYVFWEAVGVCSYLLIGFWYEKPEAAAAGKKAFLVNRVGDFGFALGAVPDLDHLRHAQLPRRARRRRTPVVAIPGHSPAMRCTACLGVSDRSNAYVGGRWALAICLLLMLGACGKSASSRCTSGCPTRWKARRPSAR